MVSSSPRRRSLARATLSRRHVPSLARAMASSRFQPFSLPLESRPIDESPSVPTRTRARRGRGRGILERSNARARRVVRRVSGVEDERTVVRSFVRSVVASSRRRRRVETGTGTGTARAWCYASIHRFIHGPTRRRRTDDVRRAIGRFAIARSRESRRTLAVVERGRGRGGGGAERSSAVESGRVEAARARGASGRGVRYAVAVGVETIGDVRGRG